MCPSVQLAENSPVSSSEIQDVSVCPTCIILCLVVRFRMCPSVQLAENSPVSSSEIQDVSVCPTCRELSCVYRMCPSVQLA